MSILAKPGDDRVQSVNFIEECLVVQFVDNRRISVPLQWYPDLLNAGEAQRNHWQTCGACYGIEWSDLDYHLSAEGLLKGLPMSLKRKCFLPFLSKSLCREIYKKRSLASLNRPRQGSQQTFWKPLLKK